MANPNIGLSETSGIYLGHAILLFYNSIETLL